MKQHRLVLALASAFVLALLAALVAFNHHKPRLLVLHTYSEEGRWEKSFNEGALRALADNRAPLAVRWHYMAFSGDESLMAPREWAAASQRARQVIDRWQPDVLLAVGEEAQDYVARHYAGRAAPRVVYATGEDPARFGFPGAANVTGVREALPLAQMLELLRHLGRPQLRLRALGVADPTGRAEREQLLAFDWGPHRLLGVELAPDWPAWQQAVQGAADADMLLVLSYAGLAQSAGRPETTSPAQLVQWTERHSPALALGVRTTFAADGGALAVAPAADGLGEQAGRLALQALAAMRQGAPLPPPQDSLDFTIALRPERLAARGLQLPTIYTQAARAAGTLYLQPPAPGRPGSP